jgi:DNA-binding transcriptional regulator YhcF (GntR family)
MVPNFTGEKMAMSTKNQKQIDSTISSLEEREKVFLSIILMNRNRIPLIKFKRIFLDKFTFWGLQRTEKKLIGKGLIIKSDGKKEHEEPGYEVPRELVEFIIESLTSLPYQSKEIKHLLPKILAPCMEYSILWYLWRIDSELGLDLLDSETKKKTFRLAQKKVEELLGMGKKDSLFLISIIKEFPTIKSVSKGKYKNWSDILNSPSLLIKDVFKLAYDQLREENELGREDVGKDNMEFLFDELVSIEPGVWHSLNTFVSNAQNTLFSCNQPFRWIHFNTETTWNLLNHNLRILGIVDTSEDDQGQRFLRITNLGTFCLERINEEELESEMESRKGKIMVHPNFEVTLVAHETQPRVLLELAMFSTPTKLDTMSLFRITKETVREGNKLGLSSSEIISFLKENCKGEIPQNVEYSIDDWGR